MGYLNKVMLIGRLGQDPEKKVTSNGTSVTNLSLATTEYYSDQGGNKQERTEWHRVVIWGKQADTAAQYLRKGSEVYFEGRLQTRSWEDQNGNKRYTTEVVANAMQFLGSSRQQQQGQGQYANQGKYGGAQGQYDNQPNYGGGAASYGQQPPGAPPAGGQDFIEDDIPF